jgi:hypothetical protein
MMVSLTLRIYTSEDTILSHFKIVKVLFNFSAPCPPLNHGMERGNGHES